MAINISWLSSHVAQNKYLHNKGGLSAVRLHISRHTWVIKALFMCLYPWAECKSLLVLAPLRGQPGSPGWGLSRGWCGALPHATPHWVSFSLKPKHMRYFFDCRHISPDTKEEVLRYWYISSAIIPTHETKVLFICKCIGSSTGRRLCIWCPL